MKMDMYIASVMLCPEPKTLSGRLMLSGCDSVWEPVRYVPDDLKPYFSDELGNARVEYGGFLFTNDSRVIPLLEKNNLFACFRGVYQKYLEHIDCPLGIQLSHFGIPLKLMGWDIANGNGWVSASCEGYYPIDPFDGSALNGNTSQINQYGLFESEKDCLKYCELNDANVSEHAPWYPVAIFVDHNSYKRLKMLEQGETDHE
jgi:hypothetical protein